MPPKENTNIADELAATVNNGEKAGGKPAEHPATEASREAYGQGTKVDGPGGKPLYEYTDANGEKFVLSKPVDTMSIEDFERHFKMSFNDVMPGRLPQNLTVTFKDPQWAGHWFNCSARRGRRIADARALGFMPASVEDMENFWYGLNDQDGGIRDDDLVLFKIHKALLYRYAFEHIVTAKRLGGKEQYMNSAEAQLQGHGGDKVGYYYASVVDKEFTGIGPVGAVR